MHARYQQQQRPCSAREHSSRRCRQSFRPWRSFGWGRQAEVALDAADDFLSSVRTATSCCCSLSHHHKHMFARLNQVARHLIRPLPNFAHNSAAAFPVRTAGILAMTSPSADERNKRTIHTAACLIIGDEVLGGKVGFSSATPLTRLSSDLCPDRRHQLRLLCQVLLRSGNRLEAD